MEPKSKYSDKDVGAGFTSYIWGNWRNT